MTASKNSFTESWALLIFADLAVHKPVITWRFFFKPRSEINSP